MATPEVFPFASIGESSGGRYPDWIRALRDRNGVYLIRERRSGKVVYIGESHTDRLYATLTRHFQRWSDKYKTAGVTYDREAVDVAAIIVPPSHAPYLQNELICEFDPRDNRLICDQIFEHAEEEQDRGPPRGYDYDVDLLMDGVFYQFTDDDADDDLPF